VNTLKAIAKLCSNTSAVSTACAGEWDDGDLEQAVEEEIAAFLGEKLPIFPASSVKVQDRGSDVSEIVQEIQVGVQAVAHSQLLLLFDNNNISRSCWTQRFCRTCMPTAEMWSSMGLTRQQESFGLEWLVPAHLAQVRQSR
jgi:hypothetical protein